MTWEYLSRLSYRWFQWLAYVPLDNKKVVELNCGKTEVDMLCQQFGAESYVANDIIDHTLHFGEYHKERDDLFTLNITECDVLLLFGIGGYEITNAEQESTTITKSTIDLMLRTKPRYVVIEGVTRFEPLLQKIIHDTGYAVMHRIATITGEGWVFQRVMFILEVVD